MKDQLPQGQEKVVAVRSMFDTIAPRYDIVNRYMSLGLDMRWRRRSVQALGLSPGATVLDLACGTGDFCRLLQEQGYCPVGIDSSGGMLEHARTTAPLVQSDALQLPIADRSIEGVTCGFALRNFVCLTDFFAELARVIRPGGRVALLDACQPESPLPRFGHRIYFGMIVPRIAGLVSDPTAYRYLPKSLAYLPPREELVELIRSAGFSNVERKLLTLGAAQLLTATRNG